MKSLKPSFRLAFLAMVLVITTASFGFANPKKEARTHKYTTASTLRKELTKLIDTPTAIEKGVMTGEAQVYFSVDELNRIHVKGIFATSEDLSRYVEGKLDGAALRTNGAVPGQEYRLTLRLVDLR